MPDIIMAAADAAYYKKFGRAFVRSAVEHGHRVHCHIINPTPDIVREHHPAVTYSSESGAMESREYYAVNRFLLAPDMLKNIDGLRLLILDIDSVICGNIAFPDAAVGLYFRQPFGANEWEMRGTRVAAGIVYYDDTAWIFAKRVAEKIRENPLQWFVDQVALAETYDEFKYLNYHDFAADNSVSWEFDGPTSTIMTAKGARKDHKKFLELQEKYKD